MFRLESIINETIKCGSLKTGFTKGKVLLAWEDVVGDAVRNNTDPKSVKNGILFVLTKNPSWAQELKAFEKDIINKINLYLRSDVVKEIRFLIDDERVYKKQDKVLEKKHEIKVTLSAKDKKDVEKLAGVLEDEELREKYRNLLIKDKKIKKLTNS